VSADYEQFETVELTDDVLAHFGVKGMHWGKRMADSGVGRVVTAAPRQGIKNYQKLTAPTPTGASRRTDHEARKDAAETAKAKMYYGEGAGTRRKLINASVASKSRDASYKKAFDHHLANQDMAKRASQARGQRHRTDAVQGTAKHARSVHRIVSGGMGNVTLAASVAVGGYALARKTGADKIVANAARVGYNSVKSGAAFEAVKRAFNSKGWK
jgi:hypothetical protein